jgi:hypothetical protein
LPARAARNIFRVVSGGPPDVNITLGQDARHH